MVSVPATAQDPAPPPPATQVVLDRYSEDISRAAFRACDVDSDDRLSMFEAGRALADVDGVHDIAGFRRLDTNADGYIEWPELDARFRQLVERGHPLRMVPQRPFEMPKESTEDATDAVDPRLKALMSSLDQNHDGRLQIAEFEAGTRGLSLPPLDADGSGVLEANELFPLLKLLPPSLRKAPPTVDRLPDGYRQADANGDGILDRDELAEALRRLDPDLVRWTDRILRDADRSNNSTLGLPELLRAGNLDR